MIINMEREPKYSLYYVGAMILEVLKKEKSICIDNLYNHIRDSFNDDISIDFIYYSLDWLYILSLIKFESDKVVVC